MSSKIFVNLPVADLDKAKVFYESIGFAINPQFTDTTAACVVISEEIYAMLLTHDKFKHFTPREIADTSTVKEVLIALSRDSREAVDDIASKALAAGGKDHVPAQDYGFMYSRSIEDLDGHVWEMMWMDESQMQE